MLAFIRINYNLGDSVEITSSEGVFSGTIEFVTNQYIVLRLPNGQVCGIAGTDVRSFRANPPQQPNYREMTSVNFEVDSHETVNEKESEQANSGVEDENDGVDEKEVKPAEKALSAFEPKVVGHIDLEALQQIDPKYGHRRYFRNMNDGDEAKEKDANQTADDSYSQIDGGISSHFVPAKGRVNFYNADRKYGFIYDFATENSLYFNTHQIADRDLYDVLYKGTKVVYSVDRNTQGLTARNIHQPKSFDDVLALAEEHMEARRLQTAKGLVEHVLEVDKNYEKAQVLLEDINGMTPAPRFVRGMGGYNHSVNSNQFLPNTLYAQAKKAYLNKNFDEAEKYYLQAIDANEKPESCVKDLVMLYVSRYKQNENAAEKEQIRQKAIAFMEKNRGLLTNNLTTKQFLALNYYLPILDFEHFIGMVDEILADPQVTNVVSRRVFFIWQKAIAFNKMGRVDDALKIIDEGLELAPRSRQLLGLQNSILHPELYQKTMMQEETQTGEQAPEAMTESPEVREADAAEKLTNTALYKTEQFGTENVALEQNDTYVETEHDDAVQDETLTM